MKNIYSIFFIVICIFVTISCSSYKNVLFSDEVWRYDSHSGNIVNADSTLQFTFGGHTYNSNMTIICNQDSLQSYPRADKYIGRILDVCGLQGCRLCFFVPLEHTMWVELPAEYTDIKPRAIVSNLLDDAPYTSWVWNDDIFEGNRSSDKIYSNAFADDKNGTIIVVDKMTYGDKPMACLSIYQSENKQTRKLGFVPYYWASNGDLLDYSYIDILSNWVDSRRETLIANYKLGQTVSYRQNLNLIREELKDIFQKDQEPRNRIVAAWQEYPNDTLLHREIAREILMNDSINLIRVCEILNNYPLVFGEENEVIWAVIQHSNLELQQKYLPLFVEAAQRGKIRGELVAVMQDRIACWSGKPQIYGSQGNLNEKGVFVPTEIENPEDVDLRRASMGMCPLKDYIEQMSSR